MLDNQKPNYETKTIVEIFKQGNLTIPEYQRPYKWTVKNTNQLIDDILLHQEKSKYRIGTMVVHDNNGELEIVDGQQRFITILLIAKVLSDGNFLDRDVSHFLNYLKFSNTISHKNIAKNYQAVINRASDIVNEKFAKFFSEQCEMVQIILKSESEAFQFFDSQNARGKDLEPHDLLKAFHLREMNDRESSEKIAVVSQWEDIKSEDLAKLFALYLYPIRQWSKGQSARYFSKSDIDIFKGINLKKSPAYPYAQTLRMLESFTQHYKNSPDRLFDNKDVHFPFQLSQTMINGRHFFDMVSYYQKSKDSLFKELKENEQTNRIISILDNQEYKHRTGDKYVRRLFNSAVFCYWDKFGLIEIEKAVKVIFLWAYQIRLTQQSVFIESIDNHARKDLMLFNKIYEATNPKEITQLLVNFKIESKAKNSESIINLAKEFQGIKNEK